MSQLKYWNGTAWAPVIVGAQGPTGATGATGPAGTATVYRWTKSMSGGETSLSGNDSNGIALTYTVGQELLHINGILQVRGTDYVASTGSTITGLAALSAGDIVDIWSPAGFNVADAYTQAVANATFPLNSTNSVAGKNFLINGGFDIWQRGTSFSMTSSWAYGAADRWGMQQYPTGGACTVTRTTDVPTGLQYSLRVQRTASSTNTSSMGVLQCIESVNAILLQGKTVTLSFWAKAGASFSGGTLNAKIQTGTAADQELGLANGSYTGNVVAGNVSPTITTTWTRYTLTTTLNSNIQEISVNFNWAGTGTAGADDSVYIAGAQLEVGAVASLFSRAGGNLQGEIDACQRYFQTLPSSMLIQGYNSSAAIFWWQPKVDMRSTPSVTLSTTTLYWESVPYTTVGSLTSASLNATKLTPTGGTLVIAGAYSPTPVQTYPTLLSGSALTFSSEL